MHTAFKTLTASLTLLGAALASGSALAGPRDDDHRPFPRDAGWQQDGRRAGAVVDERQARQQARIEQGRATGLITRAEYRDLMVQQQRISRYEWQARADGRLSWQEREQLDQMLDRAGASIRHQVRDDERSGRRVQFNGGYWGPHGDARVAYEGGY